MSNYFHGKKKKELSMYHLVLLLTECVILYVTERYLGKGVSPLLNCGCAVSVGSNIHLHHFSISPEGTGYPLLSVLTLSAHSCKSPTHSTTSFHPSEVCVTTYATEYLYLNLSGGNASDGIMIHLMQVKEGRSLLFCCQYMAPIELTNKMCLTHLQLHYRDESDRQTDRQIFTKHMISL